MVSKLLFFCFIFFSNIVFAENVPILVGVTSGPHAEIMQQVKIEAAKDNINIKIIEFSDYELPNIALDNEEIDLNSFQHLPFLKQQISEHGYHLTPIAETVFMPMGIYSNIYNDLSNIPQGSTIVLPDDKSNMSRGLKLLEKAKIIVLQDKKDVTIEDIVENPSDIKFLLIESPQVISTLEDVEFAVINLDWVILANMNYRDALILEDYNKEFVNLIVAKEKNKDNPVYNKIAKIYRSKEIKQFIENRLGDSITPSWR